MLFDKRIAMQRPVMALGYKKNK